jgi:predicted nuclease of predicted toxin-antitoxin system
VFDVNRVKANDPDIWEHARRRDAIIISKDEDFVDRWLMDEASVGLIWLRKGNCSNRALLAWFEPLWLDTLNRLEQGERFIELRE